MQPRDQLRDRPGKPLGLTAHRVGRLTQLARHTHREGLLYAIVTTAA